MLISKRAQFAACNAEHGRTRTPSDLFSRSNLGPSYGLRHDMHAEFLRSRKVSTFRNQCVSNFKCDNFQQGTRSTVQRLGESFASGLPQLPNRQTLKRFFDRLQQITTCITSKQTKQSTLY